MHRRRRSVPPLSEGSVNVTPLIDVVMVMIVFFMLVAKIGVETSDRTVAIPATILGTDIKNMDIPNSLTLNVRAGLANQPVVTAVLIRRLQELNPTDQQGKTP